MNRIRLKEITDAAGMFAIVASLIFVGIQIRQDHVIARSQLFSDGVMNLSEVYQSAMEPEIARAYAKLINSPDDLSTEELVQLDRLLEVIALLYARECYLVARGIFSACEQIVKLTARPYFGNAHGQSWWRLNGPRSVLPDWVDAEIRSVDPDYYRRRLEDTKAGMQ